MENKTADPRAYDNDLNVKSPPNWKLDQMREKAPAAGAELRAATGASQAGSLGRGYEIECARPSLRERVNSSFYRAERETRNVNRLKELADLLDTNPAIARILELIEATGV